MIDWTSIKKRYPLGTIIVGKVEFHLPFGVFVDIGDEEVRGLIQITDFLDDGIMSMQKFPLLGSEIHCCIIGYTEDSRNQIWLSVKPSILNTTRCSFC